MTHKERYDYRKANHLCTTCGEPLKDTDPRTTCSKCRKKRSDQNKIRYRECQQKGICTSCRTAKAEPGSVLCKRCTERKKKDYYEHSNEYNKTHLRKEKAKRKRLIKKGLCPKCGRHTGTERVYCDKCLEYLREQNRKSRANKGARHVGIPKAEWSQYGWCNICGIAVNDGANICPTCRERNVKQASYMRARLAEKQKEWEAKGLCSVCGKRPVLKGFKVCQQCNDQLNVMREKSMKKIRKKVMPDGSE